MVGLAFEKRKCPYCQTQTEADWVDVGVGHIQCGPFYCENCGASEIGSYDNLGYDRKMEEEVSKKNFKVPNGARITQEEYDIGWYKPHSQMGSTVNTCRGKYVKHDVAKELYDMGMLDVKEVDKP